MRFIHIAPDEYKMLPWALIATFCLCGVIQACFSWAASPEAVAFRPGIRSCGVGWFALALIVFGLKWIAERPIE